jgi:hypothetical protein
MAGEPESKSFLEKAGFENREPAKRLVFFVKKRQSGNYEISSNTSLYPGRINAPLEFLKG